MNELLSGTYWSLNSYLIQFMSIFGTSRGAGNASSGGGAGYIERVLEGAAGSLEGIITALGVFLGVVLVGYALWCFFRAATSNQQRGRNFWVGVASLLLGGFLATSAYERLSTISGGMGEQISTWGDQ